MTQISFTPFPDLATERLTLRQLNSEDENEILSLRSDERVNEFLDRKKARTIEDARKFIQNINEGIARNKWIYWAITLTGKSTLIGTICIWKISNDWSKAEIGFELLPGYQGKGIMQEALSGIIEFGFENMKLQTLEGDVTPNNLKSIRLLKRIGFIYDRKLKESVIYSLTKNIGEKLHVAGSTTLHPKNP